MNELQKEAEKFCDQFQLHPSYPSSSEGRDIIAAYIADHQSRDGEVQALRERVKALENAIRIEQTGLGYVDRPEASACDKQGHNMYSVYSINNFDHGGRSAFGKNRCSRCGWEDDWQYDF